MKEKRININNSNIIIILGIVLLFIFQCCYLNLSTSNIPLMDYWRYIHEIGEKVMTNSLSLKDFWTPSANVHRNPLLYFLLTFNIKFFHYNVLIEIFAGAIILCLISFFIYFTLRKRSYKSIHWSIKEQLIYTSISLAVFNLNQWEIMTEQFSLTFMLRILIYNYIFWRLDSFLLNDKKYGKTFINALLIFFTILLCSQGYFPALIGAIICGLILNAVINFKEEKIKYLIHYIILIAFMIIASYIYLFGLDLISGTNGGAKSRILLSFIFDGTLLKSILIMLASIIIPTSYLQKYGVNIYYFIGMIMALFVIFTIYIYFKNKIYKNTYYPIMLILYAGINIILISFARVNAFDLTYLVSSRYVVETNMLLIGTLWIIFYSYINRSNQKRSREMMVILVSAVFTILLLNIRSVEMSIAPYRKDYGDNLIKMMTNIEKTSEEDLASFQAGNSQLVVEGVHFLKKYQLGYFHNHNGERDSVLLSDDWSTLYEDGWASKKCKINVKTSNQGLIMLKGFLTEWHNQGESLEIYLNGEHYNTYCLDKNEFDIELKGYPNKENVVNIISNFQITPKPPDIRELSYVIQSIQVK